MSITLQEYREWLKERRKHWVSIAYERTQLGLWDAATEAISVSFALRDALRKLDEVKVVE